MVRSINRFNVSLQVFFLLIKRDSCIAVMALVRFIIVLFKIKAVSSFIPIN